jgi:hypothetical protein
LEGAVVRSADSNVTAKCVTCDHEFEEVELGDARTERRKQIRVNIWTIKGMETNS